MEHYLTVDDVEKQLRIMTTRKIMTKPIIEWPVYVGLQRMLSQVSTAIKTKDFHFICPIPDSKLKKLMKRFQ